MLNHLVAVANSGVSAGAGSYESIASATPTTGTVVTFSSIPSTYQSLQLRFAIRNATSTSNLFLQVNGDTAANYVYHLLEGDGVSVGAGGNITQTNIQFLSGTSTDTTHLFVGIVDIHNYSVTIQNKTIRAITGIDRNGSGDIELLSGLWRSTSAITSLSITSGTNFATTGSTISLYGIKGA